MSNEVFELYVRVVEARGLRKVISFGKMDVQCIVRCRDEETKSNVIKDGDITPRFDWKTMVHTTLEDEVVIGLRHEGGLSSSDALIGSVKLSVSPLANGEVTDDWYSIHCQGKNAGEVRLRMQLMHAGERPINAVPQNNAGASAIPTATNPDLAQVGRGLLAQNNFGTTNALPNQPPVSSTISINQLPGGGTSISLNNNNNTAPPPSMYPQQQSTMNQMPMQQPMQQQPMQPMGGMYPQQPMQQPMQQQPMQPMGGMYPQQQPMQTMGGMYPQQPMQQPMQQQPMQTMGGMYPQQQPMGGMYPQQQPMPQQPMGYGAPIMGGGYMQPQQQPTMMGGYPATMPTSMVPGMPVPASMPGLPIPVNPMAPTMYPGMVGNPNSTVPPPANMVGMYGGQQAMQQPYGYQPRPFGY